MGLRFKSKNKLDFSDITPGAEVRCTEIDEKLYLSARDLTKIVCATDLAHSTRPLKRMDIEATYEMGEDIKQFKFPGRGQQFQPVATIRGALVIINILGVQGEQAKFRRLKVMELLKSLLGDTVEMSPLKKRKITPKSYVYLLHSDAFPDYVKIGRANDIKKRLGCINCAMPEKPYQLVTYFATDNSVRDEAEAHHHFAKYRTIREFFKIKKEDVIPYFLAKQNRLVDGTETKDEEKEEEEEEEEGTSDCEESD